jgi:hypothetical protein
MGVEVATDGDPAVAVAVGPLVPLPAALSALAIALAMNAGVGKVMD